MVRTPALYSEAIRFAESAPRDTSNSASMPNFCFNKGSSSFLDSALGGIANTILPSALAFCSAVSHSPRHLAADAWLRHDKNYHDHWQQRNYCLRHALLLDLRICLTAPVAVLVENLIC